MTEYNDVNSDDMVAVAHWGQAWGKAISLPGTRENIPTIQAGPGALKNAVDYYAMCKNDKERNKVLFWFEEGVRRYANTSKMQLRYIFEDLADRPSRRPVDATIETRRINIYL